MKSWPIMIASDVDYAAEATQIDLVTRMGRWDFVTVQKSPEGKLLISRVPPQDLVDFDGPLFQADSDDELQAIVLREVHMSFWPWEEEDDVDPDDEMVQKFAIPPSKMWDDFLKTFE